MEKIYTVYQLNEKVNKLGNPYIGFTDNLIRRSKGWKRTLNLDYIPELIPLYTDASDQRAFDWEQDKRVENGWRREPPLKHLRKITKKANLILQNKEHQTNAAKIGGAIGGKRALELGVGIHTFKERSRAGKIAAKINMESGHWQKINKLGSEKSQRAINTCPYCNKTIKGPNYFKWHGENCKSKPATRSTL